jgi:aldose 1-epimerase
MEATAIALRSGRIEVDLDRRGAVISGFRWRKADGTTASVMRDGAMHGGDPLKASCFPLLPFGNRVRDNRFSFNGQAFTLTPNQPWDRHYLHGDGWLTRWNVLATTDSEVSFGMQHAAGPESPYAFAAEILYKLRADVLSVTLTVSNQSEQPLPFGLGLHPYFPLTPRTTLQASATGWFVEEAEFMPGTLEAVPDALDFSEARRPPRQWINNGFTGWNGRAKIVWPENSLALTITGSTGFRDYFVFMSDTRFEPGFLGDYFCFEPMTHRADAHNMEALGGLAVLAPGETLRGCVSFTPHETPRLSGIPE